MRKGIGDGHAYSSAFGTKLLIS